MKPMITIHITTEDGNRVRDYMEQIDLIRKGK